MQSKNGSTKSQVKFALLSDLTIRRAINKENIKSTFIRPTCSSFDSEFNCVYQTENMEIMKIGKQTLNYDIQIYTS